MSFCLDELDLVLLPRPFAKRATGTHDLKPARQLSDLEQLDRRRDLDSVDADTLSRLRIALDGLPAHYADDRALWLQVGMALKSLDESAFSETANALWHDFSARCPAKYEYEKAEADWESFDPLTVTYKKIFYYAKQQGVGIAKPRPAEPNTRRFRVMDADEFIAGENLSWFIKGVLPKAVLGVLYGASTAGKSFMALDLAAHPSLGKPWRGHRVKPAQSSISPPRVSPGRVCVSKPSRKHMASRLPSSA